MLLCEWIVLSMILKVWRATFMDRLLSSQTRNVKGWNTPNSPTTAKIIPTWLNTERKNCKKNLMKNLVAQLDDKDQTRPQKQLYNIKTEWYSRMPCPPSLPEVYHPVPYAEWEFMERNSCLIQGGGHSWSFHSELSGWKLKRKVHLKYSEASAELTFQSLAQSNVFIL